jgi:outer membrane protein assembly factor BamB
MARAAVRWILLLVQAITFADDWPQFRGPSGQGVSQAKDLPVEWSETKNIAWKTAIPGRGWSSPVLMDGRIWLTTASEEGRSLRAIAVDQQSGRIVQDVEVFRPEESLPINAKNTHASPTPLLEPGRVYVHFGTLGTAAVDADSGEVLWHNEDLKLEHKEGPGSSPVLYENLLIVHCDGMDVQYVVALDKKTGRTAWKADRSAPRHSNPDFNKAYSTPLLISADAQDQLISPGAHRVSSYDPQTGRELWWVDYPGFSNVPRPIYGHGLVFVTTGYPRPQLWAIRTGGSGNVTDTHVAWKLPAQAPANPSPILVGDELYLVSDGGVASCIDAQTGKVHWKERLAGNYSASPLAADGKLFFASEQGVTHVLRPARTFEVLASNALDGRILASPAAVGSALFVRTETHLYRIEKR